MNFTGLFRFMRRIGRIRVAEGKKRISYAIWNIVLMALAVLAALGVKWSIGMMDSSVLVGVVVLIFCVGAAAVLFLQGFVAQFVLIFVAGAGMRNPEEKRENRVAFVIALVTVLALIAACVILFLVL